MIPFSILDLATVAEGSTVTEALENTRQMAIRAEKLGYHRYWLAEHHNNAGDRERRHSGHHMLRRRPDADDFASVRAV